MSHDDRGATWPTEQQVAAELTIDCNPEQARAVLERVPFWFHTFCLDQASGLLTPGKARDHGYRLDAIPESFTGQRVLDVGTFDGFYAYLAEQRGAERVVAVDNEQYRFWVRDRWGIELRGAEGFEAIGGLLGSDVDYRRMDALDVGSLDERFDFIFCFGILHRVRNPLGLLQALVGRLSEQGRLLIETANTPGDAWAEDGLVRVPKPGGMYANDHYVYWEFSSGALRRLVSFTGAWTFETHSTPVVGGLPRIIGLVNAVVTNHKR